MAVLGSIPLEPGAAAEALHRGERAASKIWDALASGKLDAVLVCAVPEGSTALSPPRCLLPGSFNPIHEGHRRMLRIAAARLATVAACELAIVNPDKPPLSPGDAAARLARFTGNEAVWLTRAPTFPEKARIFPGATFAVGVDTIVRIAEPRYYGGPAGLETALSNLGGCRFLVFGRRTGAGFETLDSVSLPARLRALCDGVAESEFRADISSTKLRRNRDQGGAEGPREVQSTRSLASAGVGIG